MKLELTEEQSIVRDSVARLLAQSRVRERSTVPGSAFDGGLWAELAGAGVLATLVPENAGGAGLGLLEAVLIAEQAGMHLTSVPLVEAMVAGAVLARFQGVEAAAAWLADLIRGAAVVTFCVHELRDDGVIVQGGSAADAVLFFERETLILGVPKQRLEALDNLGDLPIGRFTGQSIDRHVIANGTAARGAFDAAVDQWRLLTASVLLGIAQEALRQGSLYACERTAFGRPIGGFQGLAHPLADAATDVEGGQILIRYAIWSIARGNSDASAMSPSAWWWATRASQIATLRAMRTFGGYGLGSEAQAQLCWRRSRALALIGGDSDGVLDLVAKRLWGGEGSCELPEVGPLALDFGLGDEAERFADQARRFFAENLGEKHRDFVYATADGHDPEMERALAEAGLLHADWPAAYGGQERGPLEMSALYRVYGEFDWWVTPVNTTDMVGKIIMKFGQDALKSEVLPLLGSGRANCALGYSEPTCGSDVFAAKTTAVRSGDGWVINGQKMFTSQGHFAQYTLMLTRTDPQAQKHAGLTLFLLPLNQEGYAVSRVDTLGGERTNVTYYDGMHVSDTYRLGDVNGGAHVIAAALMLEQSTGDFFLIGLRRLLKHGLAWATAVRSGKKAIDRSEVSRALARLHVHSAVLESLTRRALNAVVSGVHNRVYGPMTKLFGSEALLRCSTELMDVAGAESVVRSRSDLGWVELESRRAVATTIYAGTSEVQRSIIAEAALGLPRSRS